MLHQIGSGVLGPVFRTYDPQADKLVAVKVFRLELLPEDVARLAEGLRRLGGSPGFVAAGLENTSAYLAIDYLGGESLDVALRHLAPAPLDVALPILERAAALIDGAWAADAAFGHGALHPRDIFVTPDTNDVAITGFGVVPALEALNSPGGKAPIRRPYTAPERAAGGEWDVRADIYSLAAIAHELLTGRRPAGPSEQDGALPSSMAPEMRAHVRRVLSKALAESPSQRFSTAAEFVAALGDQTALPEPSVAKALEGKPAAKPEQEPLTLLPVVEAADLSADALAKADEFDLSHVIRQESEPSFGGAIAPPAEEKPAPTIKPAVTPPAAPRRAKSGTVAMPVVKRTDIPLHTPAPATSINEEPRFRAIEPELVRTPSHEFPMPPRIPWAPMIAVGVACLILGAAIDHQWMLSRSGSPAVTAPVKQETAPVGDGPKTPAPAAKDAGRSDTEVAVSDQPAEKPAPPAAKAAALPGKITVRSVPAGALVTIDGKSAGRTPLTAAATLAGHAVVIARPGFTSETRRVVLTRRAPATIVSVTLKAAGRAGGAAASPVAGATTGSVAIDSRPRGASITIDGRPLGQSPASVPGLAPGRHTLRLELNGYKPLDTAFTVKAGETARVAVTLEIR